MSQHTDLNYLLLTYLDRHSDYKIWNSITKRYQIENLENLIYL